jgi:ribosome recycling factor
MERKMKSALSDLQSSLGTLRTGRATPTLLDKVFVDYYGAQTPLSQMAAISAPDPRQLLIAPWDKCSVNSIVSAITKGNMGFQATKDGENVRVSVPPMNEERRREMVKQAARMGEEHKVAIRNVRRDANDQLKKMEKDGGMTKDDLARYESEVQKLTDRYIAEVEKARVAKEADIMEV